MSTPEELIAAGGAILALDTNAVTGFRRLDKLCSVVAQLRMLSDPVDVRLYVPAVVHAEVIFDLQQHFGSKYDAEAVLQGMIDRGLEVQAFERRHAEHAAARLGARYPTNKDWWAAKRKRYIDALGLDEKRVSIPASGKYCGATIDFVIAAHAEHEGWILVTDDEGPDYADLPRKMKLAHVERCLQGLLVTRKVNGPVS